MRRATPATPPPEYVKRTWRRIGAAAVAAGFTPQLGFLAAQMFLPAVRAPWEPAHVAVLLLAVSVPALVAIVVLAVRWERRLLARIAEFGGRLCPRCAYPMPGVRDAGTCPECGARCDMPAVERAWRGFLPRFRR